MPEGYIPSDFDVCSGRGKQNWNMTGTVNFRKLIHAAVDRYMAAELRNHKTAVIVSVVDEIRQKDGHFFKERKHGNSGRWYEIGDTAACKKVGHALRDQANDRTTRGVKSRSVQRAKKETMRAVDPVRDSVSMDSTEARLTETSSLPSISVQLVKEETRHAVDAARDCDSMDSAEARQRDKKETMRAVDDVTDCVSMSSVEARLTETSSLPPLSVQLVKEGTRHAVAAVTDCDSVGSLEARRVEVSQLPALSPSSSFSSFSVFAELFAEETTLDADLAPLPTLSRIPSSGSFDISSITWNTDLLSTNSSELDECLFDVLTPGDLEVAMVDAY
jgi:hypothetical protein